MSMMCSPTPAPSRPRWPSSTPRSSTHNFEWGRIGPSPVISRSRPSASPAGVRTGGRSHEWDPGQPDLARNGSRRDRRTLRGSVGATDVVIGSPAMDLAELLDSERLDEHELMDWARGRADALVAELGRDPQGGPLLQLLERDASLDVAAVSVVPEPVAAVAAEPAAVVEQPLDEPPSGPQPMLSVDELPPPPEPPRLADGEPEPMLETFDTGAIHLGTPEADALIAENSSLPLEVVGDVEPAGDVEPPADDAPPVGAETP